MHIFIVEGVRLPAVLGLRVMQEAVMQGCRALRVQKGRKRGGHAVTGGVLASWSAFTLSLHTS